MATETELPCICEPSHRHEADIGTFAPHEHPHPLCPIHGDPRDTSALDAAISRGKTLTCQCGHHWSYHLIVPSEGPGGHLVASMACRAGIACHCRKFEAAK